MDTDPLPPSLAPDLPMFRPDIPDRRDGSIYVMPENVELAVRVALATGRPLLLRGDPGSGKSSLAAYLATGWNWRYYEQTVTSRTQAQDLLWTFDSIRRLADAQLRRRLQDHNYVEPGALWWAFARESALRRGAPPGTKVRPVAEPQADINEGRLPHRAVVLIDEIDKADADLPNGLLVPLGSNEFRVTETGNVVRLEVAAGESGPDALGCLIVVTTNEERELPQAFLRRCVVVWLKHPDGLQLVAIAREHLKAREGAVSEDDLRLADQLAQTVVELRKEAEREAVRPPSTAEFLDALYACRELHISLGGYEWTELRRMLLIKQQQPD